MLTLYFGPHKGAESITKELDMLFAEADTVILELGSDQQSLTNGNPTRLSDALEEQLNGLARGIGDPHEPTGDPYGERLKQMIYRSGKKIFFERSPITEIPQFRVQLHDSDPNMVDNLLRVMKASMLKWAEGNKKRDEAFAALLSEKVYSEAGQNMLVIRGSGHRRYLLRLLDQMNVRYKAYPNPYQGTFYEEAEWRVLDGQSLTERDILRAAAEYYASESHMLPTDQAQAHSQIERLGDGELYVLIADAIFRRADSDHAAQ